jgi:O-antigen/teichoic acid export membrane protein
MSTTALVARNTVANWVGVGVGTLVLLFLTPYLVGTLGKERWGVYVIANQTLVYVGLLTLGMRGAVTRFVSQDIAAGDLAALNATLSAVALLYLLIGCVGAGVCAAFGLAAPAFFGVTLEYAPETRWLFLGVGCNFLITLAGLTYDGLLVGHQRYDLINLGSVLRDVGRIGLTVLVFSFGWITLGGLAAGLVAAHFFAYLYYRWVSRREQPGLKFAPHRAETAVMRRILGFSLWNAVLQVGNVVTLTMPIFIAGKALGLEQLVYYTVPFMMADRIRMGVGAMASTLAPLAAGTLVTGDRDHFRTLLIKGTRTTATLCFPIGAVLLVFCEPFLTIWMGPGYGWAWVVYAVLMIGMFGRISQTSTLNVLIGGGNIRGLAYIQAVCAVVTMTLTIVLATSTSLGVVGVAVGVTIPLFVSHTLFLPWYASHQAGVAVGRYLWTSYSGPFVSTLPGVGAAMLFRWLWPPRNWALLIAESVLSLGVIAVPAWYTCIDRSLRRRIAERMGLTWVRNRK